MILRRFISKVIGDGAEENPFRPALLDSYGGSWGIGTVYKGAEVVLGIMGDTAVEAEILKDPRNALISDEEFLAAHREMGGDGKLKLEPSKSTSKGGTFTDDFNRADENLEASANWTRVGGAAGAAAVRSNKCSFLLTTETAYQCPDQGSANHYTQIERAMTTTEDHFECCVRETDASNFFGTRWRTIWELYKRDSGGWSLLGNYAAGVSVGDVERVEADGNSLEFFLNGASRIGPVTDSFNNTETRQGFVLRNTPSDPTLDNFEAGVIAAAVIPDLTMAPMQPAGLRP